MKINETKTYTIELSSNEMYAFKYIMEYALYSSREHSIDCQIKCMVSDMYKDYTKKME